MTSNEVLLAGGPRDGETVDTAADTGLLEIEDGGMVHRYIPTKHTRPADGRELPVYNYDGVVNPAGAEDGVESAGRRMASPLADES